MDNRVICTNTLHSYSHHILEGISSEEEPINSAKKDKQHQIALCILQQYSKNLEEKCLLSKKFYPESQILCESINSSFLDIFPKSPYGKTPVYFPQEFPKLVLKDTGKENAIYRFKKSSYVSSILDSLDCSHLTVPKAYLYKNFIVEKRLPISGNSYHNMELYLSQPELFDSPVREMTRLFSKIFIELLLNDGTTELAHIPGVKNCVRYDNLLLYVVEKKGKKKEGKFALPDLERVVELDRSHKSLKTLARIFPLHLEIIIDEAKKLQMQVDLDSLTKASNNGKKWLKGAFNDHLEWLRKKEISTEISSQNLKITEQSKNKLTTHVEKELLKLNLGFSELTTNKWKYRYDTNILKGFLIKDAQKTAKELAPFIVALILDNLTIKIRNHQEKYLETLLEQRPLKNSDLINLRSPVINSKKLIQEVDWLIEENENIKFHTSYTSLTLAKILAHAIMEELVKCEEIFLFDPECYSIAHDQWWIRF